MRSGETIDYIVLSDLHLGESGSIFTPGADSGYDVIEALSSALAKIVSQFNKDHLPKLVLNGDILGLSFSDYAKSLSIFEAFLKACDFKNTFLETIVYIPGNHDHHIWSLAKEEHYLNELESNFEHPIGPIKSSTGPNFMDGFNSNFLNTFAKRIDSDHLRFKIFYPNFIIKPKNKGDSYLLFHHGHFAENTYKSVTKFMQAFYPELENPPTLEELESENGPFINFVFSELGRSGKAGLYFDKFMSTMSDKELLDKHIDELSINLAKALDYPYIPLEWVEKELSKTLIEKVSKKVRLERYKGNTSCSDSTMKGLMEYLNNYCSEMLKSHGFSDDTLTLIWSHTHKPFKKRTETDHLGNIDILNTGGWVLPSTVTPVIGSAIIFVNSRNEAQSLRIYNDSNNGGNMRFNIDYDAQFKETSFSREILSAVYSNKGKLNKEWTTLKEILIEEIKSRRDGR